MAELLSRTSPAALAYLGDSVFEAHLREQFLWPPQKLGTLTKEVQALTRAEGQEAILIRVLDGFPLSEEERDWIRRGRNACGRGPSRVSPVTYQAASSLETLVGYLHLADPARLAELLAFALADAGEREQHDTDERKEPADS